LAPHSELRHFFEVLGEFLGRYGIFLAIWVLAVVLQVRRYGQWRERVRQISDPALTPDWSDRRSSFGGEIRGNWQGRAASLRWYPSGDKNRRAIEAALVTPTPGRFLIERAETDLLTRQLHFGAPPVVTPIDPTDRRFRIRSTDRTLTDRLLSDARARDAIAGALAGPSDLVSLSRGRFVVRRRLEPSNALEPAVAQSLTALREMARVLG
jgi:hypothetical protein